ncbi:MAG: tRNA guanosine(15) transglycosylase TgtA [Promethearchaeota archaeon]|nr:MAG: tRNA guanosine(15) transglycosylase TgtA [Candidatus Lokiarchaeota archaeon]
MKYEIIDVDALGRIGEITIKNKKMITPNLFPVVHPFKNIISPSELKNFGAEAIFTNAYTIYQNEKLREELISKGIHDHLDFNGFIATDSGAFQQYMYNDKEFDISPDEIESFQEKISSDFPVILDIPVQLDDDHDVAKKKVEHTISRARDNINRRINQECHWIGPIHGGKFLDLLKYSATEMCKLDFDLYAIGGLVKPATEYRFDLLIKILLNVRKYFSPNKPLHMFGLGLPQFFSLAVACGCDLMDSAAYILYANEQRYFTLSTGTKRLEELIEFPCHCPICSQYTPNEVRGFQKPLQVELVAKHNLYISFSELKTIRQAIREGNLWELVETRVRSHPNLVKAVHVLKENGTLLETHEKVYKNHGRLFCSSLALYRPILQRYQVKLEQNYRVPKDAKYLILLPELDVKGPNSPSISKWLDEINNNELIPRSNLHVAFICDFFGIIPLELIDTFPMGQYEAIDSITEYDIVFHDSIEKIEKFFQSHSMHYDKCGILIPNKYMSQFGEFIEFPAAHPIQGLHSKLMTKFNLQNSIFKNIEKLLNYFKVD